MRIKRIKLYQAVNLHDGKRLKMITHLDADQPANAGIECGVQMELAPGIGVLVVTPFDATYISSNNLANFNPYREDLEAQTAKATKDTAKVKEKLANK